MAIMDIIYVQFYNANENGIALNHPYYYYGICICMLIHMLWNVRHVKTWDGNPGIPLVSSDGLK